MLEVFQWSGSDIVADTDEKMEKIKEELADVLIYCFLMGNDLGFDISEIVETKIEENNRKYPAEKAYGRADKYTAYVSKTVEEKKNDCLSWSKKGFYKKC